MQSVGKSDAAATLGHFVRAHLTEFRGLLAATLIVGSAMPVYSQQSLFKCGATYQDKPCKAGDKPIGTVDNRAAATKTLGVVPGVTKVAQISGSTAVGKSEVEPAAAALCSNLASDIATLKGRAPGAERDRILQANESQFAASGCGAATAAAAK